MEVLDNLNEESTPKYAGFWIRFVAYLLDGILLGLIIGPIFFMFFAPVAGFASFADDPEAIMAFAAGLSGFIFIELIIYVLYFAGMESSKYQATLGKMALGVIVTDENGNRISFGRGAGRFLSKILSALIFYIGFIMAGFDSRKQALHDKIASTFVIYKD
jgi:uncharacterized RDD family membrane protein YckC